MSAYSPFARSIPGSNPSHLAAGSPKGSEGSPGRVALAQATSFLCHPTQQNVTQSQAETRTMWKRGSSRRKAQHARLSISLSNHIM